MSDEPPTMAAIMLDYMAQRDEAVRLLRRLRSGPHSLSMTPWPLVQEVDAFLASIPTRSAGEQT